MENRPLDHRTVGKLPVGITVDAVGKLNTKLWFSVLKVYYIANYNFKEQYDAVYTVFMKHHYYFHRYYINYLNNGVA